MYTISGNRKEYNIVILYDPRLRIVLEYVQNYRLIAEEYTS